MNAYLGHMSSLGGNAVNKIIAGRFQSKEEADSAAARLSTYINQDDLSIFHNNPPGQHGTYPVGGDEDADPGARNAERPATIAAAGLTAGAIGVVVGGPLVGLAAAGVAAYTGSLLSTMNALSDNPAQARRHGGVILAVRLADEGTEQRVISDLEQQGAVDIEKAQGEWSDGTWADFNPVSRPKLVVGENASVGSREG